MKRLLIAISLLVLIALQAKSTTSPLDSIKGSILLFLREAEHMNGFTIEDLPNFLIYDRGKQADIGEGKQGVFLIAADIISTNAHNHYLLVKKDSFQILNMKESIDLNVIKLLQFFEKNCQYSKDEILFYMKDMVMEYQRYQEKLKRWNGVIM